MATVNISFTYPNGNAVEYLAAMQIYYPKLPGGETDVLYVQRLAREFFKKVIKDGLKTTASDNAIANVPDPNVTIG